MTFEEFLGLGWSEETKRTLIELVESGQAAALSASRNEDGVLKARVWSENPGQWDTGLVCELKPPSDVIEKAGPTALSRTRQAMDLVDRGWSAYRASKFVGISQAAVSRALKRRNGKTPCPHCGQPM